MSTGLVLDSPNGDASAPGRRVRLDQEVGAGGAWIGALSPEAALDWLRTEETAALGDATWERMRRDPGVAAALKTIVLGVLARDLEVQPNRRPGAGEDPAADPEQAAEYALSSDVARYTQWMIENLDRPILAWLEELLDDVLSYGDKLAEKVYTVEPAESGSEWAGYLRYRRLAFKPRERWRYRVDAAGEVVGIRVFTVDGEWVTLPREKFAVFSYGDRDGDPRGRSVLLPAWRPWNLRVQLWPDWHRFAKRKAEPYQVVIEGPDGLEVAGAGGEGMPSDPAEVEAWLANRFARSASAEQVREDREAVDAAIAKSRNGTFLRLPYGWDSKFLHVEGGADVFMTAFRFTMEEILRALLLTANATLDSEHNSRAQSETGENMLGVLLGALRRLICKAIEWEVFYHPTLYNWGPAVAANHTARASLGEVDPKEVTALMDAVARLGHSLAPSQLPAVDQLIGLPARRPDEIPTAADGRASAMDRLRNTPGVGGKPIGTEGDGGGDGDGDAQAAARPQRRSRSRRARPDDDRQATLFPEGSTDAPTDANR